MLIMKRFIFFALATIAILTSCSSGDEDGCITSPVPQGTGTFTDERDGTTYNYVRYGSLEWTTENLRYLPTEGNTAPDLTPITSGVYDDGTATYYYPLFGLLYDHEAAEAAVPEGWRLPTDDDWTALEQTVGNKYMAEAISLQLGGLDIEAARQYYSILDYTHVYGYYWTATTDDAKGEDGKFAYFRKSTYNSDYVLRESMTKANKLSVRLVRDAE